MKIKLFLLSLVLTVGCKEVYKPQVKASASSYLVVEGYINIGNSPTTITLTKTTNLNDGSYPPPVSGATVSVQSDDGSSYNLSEVNGGVYSIPSISGSGTANYRLNIGTPDGKQFMSDYVAYKQTPPVDSISWEEHPDGVYIFANAHDDAGSTKYYKWDFTETYEYRAPFNAQFKIVNGGIASRPLSEQIYKCWHSLNSTKILIASTAKLSKDVVYKAPIQFIPVSTKKIGVLYSILVNQSALSEEGYNYWQQLIKNTESLGSLFDAQPSQVQGNIHCVSNPDEAVIGFITASSVQQKRIFINKSQLSRWQYPPGAFDICDTVHLTGDNMVSYFQQGFVPVDFYGPYLYYAAQPRCADCTLEGGVTTKPPFWP